ncbi:MAG TPA: LLM class flavin-dependent oxidoreductase [Micropepsaceae bacterium]|nr:LLM class flavin-dependent oxidoreductase [Micropepsaceae bacterium]
MSKIKLGIVDQSPVRAGGTMADAIAETLALAKACDALGYHRYWLAEHHNTMSFAGSCPEILVGHVAAATKRIRVGSGGVMLPHYSPMKVAEQFRMLETLHPGRIDLGLGRAPGADPRTTAALQAGPKPWPIEVYPQQVELVRGFLEEANGSAEWGATHPYRGIHAMPRGPGMPEMWILGSSGDSALIAAELGLPYSFAHFIGGAENLSLIDLYRERFKPRRPGDHPRVSIGLSVLVAETEEEARRRATSRNLWVLRLLAGRSGAFPSIEEALAYPYNDVDRAQLAGIEARSVTGTPAHVRARLEELAGRYGAEEILTVTITYDFAHRLQSYELLAEVFGIKP